MPCYEECTPGLRVCDLWNKHIECDRSDDKTIGNHLDTLSELCKKATSDTSQVIWATNASVPTSDRWQAVSVTACWVGGSQTSSVKALAGRVTSIDTELFEICLATAKVSITGCLNISVIADSSQLQDVRSTRIFIQARDTPSQQLNSSEPTSRLTLKAASAFGSAQAKLSGLLMLRSTKRLPGRATQLRKGCKRHTTCWGKQTARNA